MTEEEPLSAEESEVPKGHALEFSVKVGLPGGHGNVAVLTSAHTATDYQ
jgi:hypothetical protein